MTTQLKTKEPSDAELLKRKANYMVVSMGYSHKFVFPYEEGMKLIDAFQLAESYKDEYKTNGAIVPISGSFYSFDIISQEKYLAMKMNYVLGIGDLSTEAPATP